TSCLSDWSSDVCSSDLGDVLAVGARPHVVRVPLGGGEERPQGLVDRREIPEADAVAGGEEEAAAGAELHPHPAAVRQEGDRQHEIGRASCRERGYVEEV